MSKSRDAKKMSKNQQQNRLKKNVQQKKPRKLNNKLMSYYVYILHCDNGAYYTGYTTDLMRRYQEHVKGTRKCKFTQSFKPLNIAQSWEINGTKSLAMKIEKHIKMLNRKEKQYLIQHPHTLSNHLA